MRRRYSSRKPDPKGSGMGGILIFFFLIGIIVGTIYGIRYLTSISDFGYLDWIIIIFGIIFLVCFLIILVWRIRVFFEKRTRKRLRLVLAEQGKKLVSEEELILKNVIKPQIIKIGGTEIQLFSTFPPHISFNIPKGNQLAIFVKITIKIFNPNSIEIASFLKEELPLSYSIKEKSFSKEESSSIGELQNHFVCNSTHQHFYNSLLYSKNLTDNLLNLKGVIDQISMTGKFVNAKIKLPEKLTEFLKFISDLHDAIIVQDFGDFKVEQLLCYQCEDRFNVEEETCDKCGATRPVCQVCLLVLKPSEKKNVVKTPCCETYSHKEHLITWLESNPTCPNCKKDLYLWLRTLKQQ